MSISFEMEGTEKLKAALLRAGEHADTALGAGLFKEGEKIMRRAKRLAPADRGATGLRGSGFVNFPVKDQKGVSVTLGFGGAAAPYALYVHEGTGPAVGRPAFKVSSKHFVDWVRRKGIGKKWQMSDESAAAIVARKVGAHGLQPTKFLEKPFREAKTGFNKRLARNVRMWIRREGL